MEDSVPDFSRKKLGTN